VTVKLTTIRVKSGALPPIVPYVKISGALPRIVPYVKMVLYLGTGLHFILLCYLGVLENVVCFVC